MESWKVMHKLPFFPYLGSDLSWSPQNVMKIKPLAKVHMCN